MASAPAACQAAAATPSVPRECGSQNSGVVLTLSPVRMEMAGGGQFLLNPGKMEGRDLRFQLCGKALESLLSSLICSYQ